MSADAAEGLGRLLEEFNIPFESEGSVKLRTYLALLQKWNARINLTASTEWHYLKPLFEESIWAAGFYPDWSERHLDIGSGAGFPAIPLAIVAPHVKLEMVESRAKKAFFLENVIRDLAIDGARVHQARLREYLGSNQEVWDCFSWKGLKLNTDELEQMSMHANRRSQFWMFHGKDLAVQDPKAIEGVFAIMRSERFRSQKEWKLTIFNNKRK
jgi:16S rRNA (guanine(527)-N(7))-methyltransferase RsmG